LTCLLLALSSGNSAWNIGGWKSTYILTCFGLAALGLVTFLVNEWSVRYPLLDLSLFANFNFAASNVVMFLFGLGMFGSTFLLPIFLQNMLGYTPLSAGLVFLPVGIIQGLSSPLAGFYTDRYNPKLPLILGLFIMAATFFQFRYLSLYSGRSQIMFPLYLRGFAMGILFPPLTTLAISDIPNRKMAQASALINVIRQIGGSVGVALFGSILIQRTTFHTALFGEQVNPHSEAYRHFVRSYGDTGQGAARANAFLHSMVGKQAFVAAIDDVFLAAALILLITIVPVALLRVR
jgi:DHA2 family multidrug resistance protein